MQNNGNSNVNLGLNYLTIDDIIDKYGKKAFKGKTVLIRSDLNSTLDKNFKVSDYQRIESVVPTINELSGLGAKVLVLSHQGRHNQPDSIPLNQHAEILEDFLDKKVEFHKDYLFGEKVEEVLKKMNFGDIFLLDNVRRSQMESIKGNTPLDYNKTELIQGLEPLVNLYINDSFSNSHRNHASMVGFINTPNIACRLMEKELNTVKKASTNIEEPYKAVLGGIKINDYMDYIEKVLKTTTGTIILSAGGLGMLCLLTYKDNIGGLTKIEELLKDKKIDKLKPKVKQLLEKYSDRLLFPEDFVVKIGDRIETLTREQILKHPNKDLIEIYDTGSNSAFKYKHIIKKESKTVYKKGPMGKFEDGFDSGEKIILKAMQEAKLENNVTTITGGGDTSTSIHKLGFTPQDFSYFFLSGGASIKYLTGNKILPALISLNTTYNESRGMDLYSGIPKGYDLGFKLVAPNFNKFLR